MKERDGKDVLFLTGMFLSKAIPFLLLPLVAAEVHKLKLHKIPFEPRDPALEAAYLAEKYAGSQMPLIGAGGVGRKLRTTECVGGGSQREVQGGHPVPLTSKLGPRRQHIITERHTDFANAQYYAEIGIGTPEQKVIALVVP